MPTACACFEVMQTLWLAPFVLDPAAMLRAESTAIMDIVSWLSLLTLAPSSPPRNSVTPVYETHASSTCILQFSAGLYTSTMCLHSWTLASSSMATREGCVAKSAADSMSRADRAFRLPHLGQLPGLCAPQQTRTRFRRHAAAALRLLRALRCLYWLVRPAAPRRIRRHVFSKVGLASIILPVPPSRVHINMH